MNNLLATITVLFGIIYSNNIQAQEQRDSIRFDIIEALSNSSSGGKVVLKGVDIKTIVKEQKSAKKEPIRGYRIRIFRDQTQQARSKSDAIMKEISREYPNLPVYRIYTQPNTYVDVGDFRTRDDVSKMLNILKLEYPTASMLVNQPINFPPL